MPLEDDPAFQNPGPRPDPTAASRRRYHEMTPEERRDAWDALRRVQSQRARSHSRVPLVLAAASVLCFVLGAWWLHTGHTGRAGIALWTGTGLAGFAVIAFVRHMMGALAKKREDFGPPGF